MIKSPLWPCLEQTMSQTFLEFDSATAFWQERSGKTAQYPLWFVEQV